MNFKDYLRQSLNEAEVSPIEIENPMTIPGEVYDKLPPEILQFYDTPLPHDKEVLDDSPYWEQWGEPQEYDWNNDGILDLVYISPDGRIVIIDRETGEIIWQSHPTPQVIRREFRKYPIESDNPLQTSPVPDEWYE